MCEYHKYTNYSLTQNDFGLQKIVRQYSAYTKKVANLIG